MVLLTSETARGGPLLSDERWDLSTTKFFCQRLTPVRVVPKDSIRAGVLMDQFMVAFNVGRYTLPLMAHGDNSVAYQWRLIFQASNGTAAVPSALEIERALRNLTGDAGLSCLEQLPNGDVLIESSFEGFTSLEEKLLSQPDAAASLGAVGIDLLFTKTFADGMSDGEEHLQLWVLKRYGPLLQEATKRAWERARRWTSYSLDELFNSVWIHFIEHAENIFCGYNAALGSKTQYLYTVASRKAKDYLRAEIRSLSAPGLADLDNAAATAGSQTTPPAKKTTDGAAATTRRPDRIFHVPIDLPTVERTQTKFDELLLIGGYATAKELTELLDTYKERCKAASGRRQRQRWQLVMDAYFGNLSTEELMARYELSEAGVAAERHRAAQDLLELWMELHPDWDAGKITPPRSGR